MITAVAGSCEAAVEVDRVGGAADGRLPSDGTSTGATGSAVGTWTVALSGTDAAAIGRSGRGCGGIAVIAGGCDSIGGVTAGEADGIRAAATGAAGGGAAVVVSSSPGRVDGSATCEAVVSC